MNAKCKTQSRSGRLPRLRCHSEERSDEESPLVDMLTVGEILRYAQNDIPN